MVSTRSSPRNSTPMARTPREDKANTPKRARRPRTRIQLTDDDDGVNEDDGIAVSSGVVVAAMRPALRDPADGNESDNQAQDNNRARAQLNPPAGGNQPGGAPQQRAMMKRFLIQPPPAATPAPQPVIVQAPATPAHRTKMKTLNLTNFYGKPSESIEAWLAKIPQEVERQAGLGGDTWTADELYLGVSAHLQGEAGDWLTTLTETMREEDKTLSYLVKKLRKKYGSRDNLFKTQQKLAARVQQPGERLGDFASRLRQIGFGKRVPEESYVEAFLNGINNEMVGMQIRGHHPETLDDAVQLAEDASGVYGEGVKVTDWRVARKRYREDGVTDSNQEGTPSAKRKASATAVMDQNDWAKLGLGSLSLQEEQPIYDKEGGAIDQWQQSARRDPLSIAALQALILTARNGHEETKTTAPKSKARVMEMKAESREDTDADGQQQTTKRPTNPNWQERGGRGGHRSSGHYGPMDTPEIQQRKANTKCGYCGKSGHWWRECRTRLKELNGQQPAQQQQQPARATARNNGEEGATATTTSAAPAATAAAPGNGQRQ
eukprot:jgi/Phyca11/122255/e_gw1.47.277.1